MAQSISADMVIRSSCGQPGIPIVRTFSAVAAESSALTKGVTYMFQASKLCHIRFTTAGGTAATTSSHPVAAGAVYLYTANTSDIVVSCIQNEETGTLWITPMSPALPE